MLESLPAERSTTDRRIAGVCGALAQRWSVDPVLLRVMAVTLALSGGVGIALYGVAWVWLPSKHASAPVDRMIPGLRNAKPAWLALLATVIIIPILAVMSVLLPFGIAPAIIISVTWWICGRQQRRTRMTHRLLAEERARAQQALLQQPHGHRFAGAPPFTGFQPPHTVGPHAPTRPHLSAGPHPSAEPGPHPRSPHAPRTPAMGAPGPVHGHRRPIADAFPEPEGLASEFVTPPGSIPGEPTTGEPAAEESTPPRRRSRRVLITLLIVLALGGTIIGGLISTRGVDPKGISVGVAITCVIAGIAGLLASRTKRTQTPARNRTSGHSAPSESRSTVRKGTP